MALRARLSSLSRLCRPLQSSPPAASAAHRRAASAVGAPPAAALVPLSEAEFHSHADEALESVYSTVEVRASFGVGVAAPLSLRAHCTPFLPLQEFVEALDLPDSDVQLSVRHCACCVRARASRPPRRDSKGYCPSNWAKGRAPLW